MGAGIADAISRLAPEGLIGVHTNLLVPALDDPAARPGDKGGHFAAWEEPELFSNEMRAAFKSLR